MWSYILKSYNWWIGNYNHYMIYKSVFFFVKMIIIKCFGSRRPWNISLCIRPLRDSKMWFLWLKLLSAFWMPAPPPNPPNFLPHITKIIYAKSSFPRQLILGNGRTKILYLGHMNNATVHSYNSSSWLQHDYVLAILENMKT